MRKHGMKYPMTWMQEPCMTNLRRFILNTITVLTHLYLTAYSVKMNGKILSPGYYLG